MERDHQYFASQYATGLDAMAAASKAVLEARGRGEEPSIDLVKASLHPVLPHDFMKAWASYSAKHPLPAQVAPATAALRERARKYRTEPR